MATMEKLGMATGLTATHPLTGEDVPIWVANFVLMSYGSGAVMSVPAHDQRDHAFASKYDLPIVQVIASPAATTTPVTWQDWYAEKSARETRTSIPASSTARISRKPSMPLPTNWKAWIRANAR